MPRPTARAWPLQVHPPQDTKASRLPAQQAVWTCFPRLPAAPSVQQGSGPETPTGPDNPGRPATLEQGADTQQAWPPATALRPQRTLQGSHPARPLLPGTCRLTSGRLHQVQARVTRGAEGLRGVGLEPAGARARCAGPAGASQGAFTGVSWDQLPRRGQEQVCTWAWRAVSAPGRAGGLQGEGAAPSDGGGTQGLTASILHVHSFPEPSPGVEPSVVAQQPWSDQ